MLFLCSDWQQISSLWKRSTAVFLFKEPNSSLRCYAKKLIAEKNLKHKFLVTPTCAAKPGPAPRGGIPGLCPPKWLLVPPATEDCAPKKLTGSELVECKSRLKTPELVFTARIHTGFHKTFGTKTFFFLVFIKEFQENRKNFKTITRICVIFCTENLFFGLHLFRLIHTRINFSCPRALLEFTWINFSCPQNLFIFPQSRYPGARPRQSIVISIVS